MTNRIEAAIKELAAAIEENPDHIYSDSFRDTLDCLTNLAGAVQPEYRFLQKYQLISLQDLAHTATVLARIRTRHEPKPALPPFTVFTPGTIVNLNEEGERYVAMRNADTGFRWGGVAIVTQQLHRLTMVKRDDGSTQSIPAMYLQEVE